MESRTYKFNNSRLTLIFGSILQSEADVIVSSDDTEISMGGGVSGHILNAGGEFIRKDAQKKLPAQLGDVVVSTAGDLQSQKFVFHCLTINHNHKEDVYKGFVACPDDIQNYILRHSVDKCFRLLHALDLTSIAFPCIGAGLAHISLSKIASVMADAITENLSNTQKEFDVELYLFDRNGKLTQMDYIELFENFAIKSAISQSQERIVKENCTPVESKSVPVVPKRENMTHDIFISYSRADSEQVMKIRNILDESGLQYWIDKEGVYSGENYKEVIVDAIDVSKVVMFISSVNSNNSINVIRELGYAVSQKKTIIPVLLDDSQYAKSIRLDIADIDQINFMDSDSNHKLKTSLAYALGR